MVLNDVQLIEWAESGGVVPFTPTLINPASVDLRWSGRYRAAVNSPELWSEVKIAERLTLAHGSLYLLDTEEVINMPNDCIGLLMLKSSLGRKGLEHLHAGLFDPAFTGTGTLEMAGMHPFPVTITRGQPIVQLVMVMMTEPPVRSYALTGRYNGQSVPQVAR